MTRFIVALVLVHCCGWVFPQEGQTVTEHPVAADTTVVQITPHRNHGAAPVVVVARAPGHIFALVRADLTEIEAWSERHERLQVELLVPQILPALSFRPHLVAELFPLTKSWQEMGATWQTANDTNTSNNRVDGAAADRWKLVGAQVPWDQPSVSEVSIPCGSWQPIRWDVTDSFSQSLPTHGWVIQSTGPGISLLTLASRSNGWAAPRLRVTWRNAPPQPVDDAVVVLAGQTMLISVLDNDTDPEGGPLRLVAVTAPALGVASIENGQVRFTAPAGNFAGTSFTYVVADMLGSTATATVQVTGMAGNQPPTFVQAPSAHPNPVTTISTTLRAAGTDTETPDALTYIWSVSGPAPVTLHSTNGTAIAAELSASFTAPGRYEATCVVADPEGLTAVGTVEVEVVSTPAAFTLQPATASLVRGASRALIAAATDQFGAPVALPPLTWSSEAGGVIDQAGIFTAGMALGPVEIVARHGDLTATATMTVINGLPVIAEIVVLPNPVPGTAAQLQAVASDDAGPANLRYAWTWDGPQPVQMSINGTIEAQTTRATFSQAGTYQATLTVTDSDDALSVSHATVVVLATATTVTVSPASATIMPDEPISLAVSVQDQFGNNVATEPVQWTANGGMISETGVFTASEPGSYLVTATVSGIQADATITVSAIGLTFVEPAQATPNPVSGVIVTLTARALPSQPDLTLSYRWHGHENDPAAVFFVGTTNGTEEGHTVQAIVTASGTYQMTVEVRQSDGAVIFSTVEVVVESALSRIVLDPEGAIVGPGQAVTYTATAVDQFNVPMVSHAAIDWLIDPAHVLEATDANSATIRAGTTLGRSMVQARIGAVVAEAPLVVDDGALPLVEVIATVPVLIESDTVSYEQNDAWPSGSVDTILEPNNLNYWETDVDGLSVPIWSTSLPLAFEFPLFGGRYNEVEINSSGQIYLIDEGSYSTWTPNYFDPGDQSLAGWRVVVPFFMDVDLEAGGTWSYGQDESGLLLRWEEVPLRSDPGVLVTAEVNLTSEGTIIIAWSLSGWPPYALWYGVGGADADGSGAEWQSGWATTTSLNTGLHPVTSPLTPGSLQYLAGALSGHLEIVQAVTGTADPETDVTPPVIAGPTGLYFYSGEASVPIAAVVDDDDEGTESLTLQVVPGTGYRVGPRDRATILIQDPVSLGFVTTWLRVPESAGYVMLPIALSRPLEQELRLPWHRWGSGGDGETRIGGPLAGTLIIPPGVVQVHLMVPIFDDEVEGEAMSTFELGSPMGDDGLDRLGVRIQDEFRMATIALLDDDFLPTVQWSSGSAELYENSYSATQGWNAGYLYLPRPFGRDLFVHLELVEGTASSEDLYFMQNPIWIPAGVNWVPVPVIVVDDDLREGREQGQIAIVPDPQYALGTLGALSFTILGNDNNAPLLDDFSVSCTEDSAVVIPVLAFASDPDGDGLLLPGPDMVDYAPRRWRGFYNYDDDFPATVTVNPDQTLTFTPDPGVSGVAYLFVGVSDDFEDDTKFAWAYVTITIHAKDPHTLLVDPAAAFDAQRWQDDLAYRQGYLAGIIPGRVWQRSEPGPTAPMIHAPDGRDLQTSAGSVVTLSVLVPPAAPVSFSCFGMGSFPSNGRNAITVQANAQGIAQVSFQAPRSGTAPVLAASPLATGAVRFAIRVTP